MSYTQRFMQNETHSYCDLTQIDETNLIKSLKHRLYWCLGFTLVTLTISPSFRYFIGIEVGDYTNGNLFTEFLCVTVIFFCGANRFLTNTYYKFKNHRATSVDLLLLIVALGTFIASLNGIVSSADDSYALKFIIIIDALLFFTLIKMKYKRHSI